jgi:molecular chaperone DnaK (HSP70)
MTCDQDIIVGIDFGTTASGASFSEVHNLSCSIRIFLVFAIVDSEHSGIALLVPPYGRAGNVFKDIKIFRSWGGSYTDNGPVKPPSVLAYSGESPSLPIPPWGAPILAQHMDSFSWFKLLLDEELDIENWIREAQGWADSRGIFHIPEGMSPLRVITDFLTCLHDALWQRLKVLVNTTGGSMDTTSIQFWFTVPVSWSDMTRELMREAIRNAGFGMRYGDQVHLLTEPQAAMTFALAQVSSFTVYTIISSTKLIWL